MQITFNVLYYAYYMKVHAPGCPVMIVGTHNDVAGVKEDDISQTINDMYSDNHFFPTIAGICCISNIRDRMRRLRNKIYSVAIHLHCDKRNRC